MERQRRYTHTGQERRSQNPSKKVIKRRSAYRNADQIPGGKLQACSPDESRGNQSPRQQRQSLAGAAKFATAWPPFALEIEQLYPVLLGFNTRKVLTAFLKSVPIWNST